MLPMIEMTTDILALLVATGFCAGFVDSIAGGGGLISLPILISVGLPPQLALGTNKLQSSFGTLFAAYNYIKKGVIDVKTAAPAVVFTFLGAAIGSWAVQQMDAAFIRHLIPVMLLLVLAYMIFSKNPGDMDRSARMPAFVFALVFGLALGFYDGFFGPGTGSFWTAALIVLLGHNMTRAAGFTRIVNLTSNVVALGGFILGGNVMWSAGLCMAAGQIVGARVGSGLAIKNGARFIRPVFITVVLLTIVRLIYVNYAHLIFSS
ncbi:MAG: TSUP family transporter [Desulfobacterales bacterium]|nr:TSUP family transporter [Desulfobacterales bacterium]